jgi:hypothetical protein
MQSGAQEIEFERDRPQPAPKSVRPSDVSLFNHVERGIEEPQGVAIIGGTHLGRVGF